MCSLKDTINIMKCILHWCRGILKDPKAKVSQAPFERGRGMEGECVQKCGHRAAVRYGPALSGRGSSVLPMFMDSEQWFLGCVPAQQCGLKVLAQLPNPETNSHSLIKKTEAIHSSYKHIFSFRDAG